MRIVKFSLVGVIGMGVQLAVLGGLSSLGTYYLVATICGVETAVLHNFYWHRRFTWQDRGERNLGSRLFRFHVSNAAISLLGNVGLMRVLVGKLRMNLILGNMLAVLSCAVFNYLISDICVFTQPTPENKPLLRLNPPDTTDRASGSEFAGQKERRGAPPCQPGPAPSRSVE
jgi:dolichol-phosphate mannosyltransferase